VSVMTVPRSDKMRVVEGKLAEVNIRAGSVSGEFEVRRSRLACARFRNAGAYVGWSSIRHDRDTTASAITAELGSGTFRRWMASVSRDLKSLNTVLGKPLRTGREVEMGTADDADDSGSKRAETIAKSCELSSGRVWDAASIIIAVAMFSRSPRFLKDYNCRRGNECG
jgi:hypothetical protein